MNLFNNRVASVSARSEEAIGIFYKTLAKLKEVNKTISEYLSQNELDINKLEEENQTFLHIKKENQRVASKIEDIFGLK